MTGTASGVTSIRPAQLSTTFIPAKAGKLSTAPSRGSFEIACLGAGSSTRTTSNGVVRRATNAVASAILPRNACRRAVGSRGGLLTTRAGKREQPECVRGDLGAVGVTPRDRIAAVDPLAESEHRTAGGNLRAVRSTAQYGHRPQHLQLRQFHSGIAANSRDQTPPASTHGSQAMRPRSVTTPETRPASRLDAPHRAVGEDLRAWSRAASAIAGAAMLVPLGRRSACAAPPIKLPRAPDHRFERRALRAAGFDLILLARRPATPPAPLSQLWSHRYTMPARRNPVSAVDARVHVTPQAQAFHRQWDFARVAAHGPAPAPVAAGLLAADPALFAQDDRVPLSARNSAVQVPMMPPPMMTTSGRSGRLGSEGTRSTGGDMRWGGSMCGAAGLTIEV